MHIKAKARSGKKGRKTMKMGCDGDDNRQDFRRINARDLDEDCDSSSENLWKSL
jgi:hypothetical protein